MNADMMLWFAAAFALGALDTIQLRPRKAIERYEKVGAPPAAAALWARAEGLVQAATALCFCLAVLA